MSGTREPVLYHKDLLVGVVGGEWFLFVLDVVLLGQWRGREGFQVGGPAPVTVVLLWCYTGAC